MRYTITILIGLVATFTVIGTSACGVATQTGPPPVNISGVWRYTALQQSPTQSSLTGTLTVSAQSGSTFDGIFDAVETLPDGITRRLAGAVHGQTLDASTLDFDVMLDVSRRHVAAILADTAAGSWLAAGATSSTGGTFRMVRVR